MQSVFLLPAECSASQNNEINRFNVRVRRSFVDRYDHADEPPKYSNVTKKQSREWRENDFDVTEERIEGIEELVGRLEKTVQKLSRKVIKICWFLIL